MKYSELDLSNLEKIGSGKYGEVYRNDDIAIKKYFDVTKPGCIEPKMFARLKKIKCPAFIDLIDCSYEFVNIFNTPNRKVSSYSSTFVEGIDDMMIDLPMDYTLNSLREFKGLVSELNKNNILIVDTNSDNTITTKDNLVVIDPDFYIMYANAHEDNLKIVNNYVVDLWAYEYGITKDEDKDAINGLFFSDNMDDYLPVMKERLDEKTPRDLIEKTLKKTRN